MLVQALNAGSDVLYALLLRNIVDNATAHDKAGFWHYVLLTGIEGDGVLVFDPYDPAESFPAEGITVVQGHDGQYNRIVPRSRFETQELRPYGLGPYETREAVLLFNTAVELTEENTVEYII